MELDSSDLPRGRKRGFAKESHKLHSLEKRAKKQTIDNDEFVQTDIDILQNQSGPIDFSHLQLKPDHEQRPLWVCGDGRIILEAFHPLYRHAYDFLVAIAEPLSRPLFVHEWRLTEYSLYAAVSFSLKQEDIISTLEKMCKTALPQKVVRFIEESTASYGKVKLVLKQGKIFVETEDPQIMHQLLTNDIIKQARVGTVQGALERSKVTIAGAGKSTDSVVEDIIEEQLLADNPSLARVAREIGIGVKSEDSGSLSSSQQHSKSQQQQQQQQKAPESRADDHIIELMKEKEENDVEMEPQSFEIKQKCLGDVKEALLNMALPALEEYDFRHDTTSEDLEIDLRPTTVIRSYQERSLSKMFGHDRARSGIIVLPCGAGKTLVGIAAAATIKKSTIVLCTSGVAMEQWRSQFLQWSTVRESDVSRFSADHKEYMEVPVPVSSTNHTGKDYYPRLLTITTYQMLSSALGRESSSNYIVERLRKHLIEREWGLMILDEVHVSPAETFKRVMTQMKTHCRLGLTATLVREDNKVKELNFLIGSKLYEANWLDLSSKGFLAKVECCEVWCPMSPLFFREYYDATKNFKETLTAMNPSKFRACQFLIRYHEDRGDKIIVFADNIYALRFYGMALKRPMIYGATDDKERCAIFQKFQHTNECNTILVSKVGDTSIDLPGATVIIQISSHYGSRRQEAQRLGRILRPKGKSRSNVAYFYTLVSQDTQEMYYSTKRQQFLLDQGYSFKINIKLGNLPPRPDMMFNTEEEHMTLLATIKTDTSNGSNLEVDKVLTDHDEIIKAGGASRLPATRVSGGTSALTGEGSKVYVEFNAANRAAAPSMGEKSKALRGFK